MSSLCVLSVARRCADHTDPTGKTHVPLRATAGHTCQSCRDRLAHLLTELPGTYDDLELQLRRQGNGMQPRVSGSGSPENEPPFVAQHVVELRDQVRHDLVWWAWHAADNRQLTRCSGTVEAACVALETHLDWMRRQDAVTDFADVVVEMSSAVWRAAYPSGARCVPLGPCVEDNCDGTLVATVRTIDDLLPSTIRCDTDDAHEWPADRWLSLGRRIHTAA